MKTQHGSFVELTSPLGPNVLVLESLRGSEALSRPFWYRLEMISENRSVDFSKIVGKAVKITIDLPDLVEKRYIHGIISRFGLRRKDRTYTHYYAEVVPWLWRLGRMADCRIFQEKTAPEIIKQVFSDRGENDFRDELEGEFPELPYCVQYRERDLDFVQRLMQEFGIAYFFEHDKDKHVLVLANSPKAYKPVNGQETIRYKEDPKAVRPGIEASYVTALQAAQRLQSGKITLKDYNFEAPVQPMASSVPTNISVGGNDAYEIYDYPGRYPGKHPDAAGGEFLARLRMEERETMHFRIKGQSTCRAFMPGFKFELIDHYRPDLNQEYLLTRVNHKAQAGELDGGEMQYTNRFIAIPGRRPYRPAPRSRKPIVEGPQTAKVVGPPNEEIYTDKYGRVKVQFHWDRKGESNEKSSCWVRVSQLWAGKNYGAIFIPRIGQEVIVDFLEGDPDRPIITGRVYNADESVGYTLPTDQTKSFIKTSSSKGGGGYNELRFEDAKDKEEVFLQAQKDFNENIKNDHTVTVGGYDTTTIKKNQTFHIEGHHMVTVDGTGSSKASGPDGKEIKGGSLTITGNYLVSASDKISITAPNEIKLSCGGSTITMVPDKITIHSGGGAQIELTGDAVTQGKLVHLSCTKEGKITAPNINIEAESTAKVNGNGAELKLSSTADLSGTTTKVVGNMVKVNGSGTVEIKGALVKIN